MTSIIPKLDGEIKPPFHEEQAQYEAERCLICGTQEVSAPCQVACPAGIDVPGFISAIGAGQWNTARDIIFAENPLGGTCALVCPAPVLCEGACVLNHIGLRSVEVARLQRFASDHGFANLANPVRHERSKSKIAVVGAGPSGLACASDLVDRGYQVTIYEAETEAGGLVRTAIAPYRQPTRAIEPEVQALMTKGVQFEFNQALTTREDFQQLEAQYSAIFLGVGLGADMALDVPGHQLAGVWGALPFIERARSGNWTPSARSLVVIGAGNTAIDVARIGIRLGIPDVAVFYRRIPQRMKAYDYEVQEAILEGVHFQWQAIVVEVLGSWRVQGVRCRQMGPVEDSMPFVLNADLVVSAIGQKRRAELDTAIQGLTWDGHQLVVDPETGQTANPQYFAAGDAIGGTTVVEAVRGAKIAARGISQWVRRSA
ncbi:MAG: FAD-dependent oxidoreductase [Firmicutes bacterium]|nr:FAD-dependent oxidoreductase [Bacillota bacterium]